MRETKIKLTDSREKQIYIGRTGEHDVNSIVFDISHYIDLYGDVTASIVVSESVYKQGYPIPCTQDGATVTIPVTDALTRRAISYMEVRMSTGDGLAKSEMVKVICANALPDAVGDAPEPIADWIAKAESVLKNLTETGIDPEIIKESLSEYLKNNPIEVDTLTEEEVRAIVESYGYLSEHQSLADYYTKDEINEIESNRVQNIVASLNQKADADSVYTKEEADAKTLEFGMNALAEVMTMLDGYATKEDIPDPIDVQINGESIVEDGVANIPIAGDNYGTVKLSSAYSGLAIHPVRKTIEVNRATESLMSVRSDNHYITPFRMDFALRIAMCDGVGAAWTPEEQAKAQERMGIYPMSEEGY